MTRWYRRVMGPLIADSRRRILFLAGVVGLLLAAMALVPLRLVTVKMLPFDNKSEFQVIVDMPEGHVARADRARDARALAAATLDGSGRAATCRTTSARPSPYNFNGLVRHYFLRQRAAPGRPAGEPAAEGRPRRDQSHDIAKRVRERAGADRRRRFGATIQVAEVPPGPPVLQTLVAEIYGPDARRAAPNWPRRCKRIFEQTPGVVDVDWYVEDAADRS